MRGPSLVKRSICRAALTGTFLVPLAAAQTEPAPIPVPMEERVIVQLVQVPFVATDRMGNPVTDLKMDEIRIKVGGVTPRAVYLDRLGVVAEAQVEPVADVRLFLDAPGGWSTPTPAGSQGDYLAIVVDNENDPPLRREESVDDIVKFLERDVDPALRIAVLSYGGTLNLELPFTTDRDAAKSAVRVAVTREGRPRIDPRARIRQLLSRFDDCVLQRGDFSSTADARCVRDVSNEYVSEMRPRSMDFIVALEGLVEYLGGLQGRKSVFVLSHGFPIDLTPVVIESARAIYGNVDALSDLRLYLGFGDDPRIKMDRLIENLIRQRVTMTFVDRTAAPSEDTGASRGEALVPGTSPMRAEHEAAVADMEQIAVSSGGLHVRSTDLGAGLEKALEAQDSAYELGFQVDQYLDSNKLQKISLDCTRKGVKLHHRRGAYSAPSETATTMRGGFSFAKGRPLVGERAPGIHQPFFLRVDPDDIGYELTESDARADFTVHMLVERASDAMRLGDAYHFINHSYARANWEASDRPPMTLSGWVELPPGDYVLRAWIRNVRTGREGTVRRAVRVPTSFPAPVPAETIAPPPESKPPGEG